MVRVSRYPIIFLSVNYVQLYLKSRQTHPSTTMEANVVAAVSSILRIVDLKVGSESRPRPRSSSPLSCSNGSVADSPGVREKYLAARQGAD